MQKKEKEVINMTYQELTKLLDSIASDIIVDIYGDDIEVTIKDFEGFDIDGNEIIRDLDNEAQVETVLDILESECTKACGNDYRTYYFADFSVTVGGESFNI